MHQIVGTRRGFLRRAGVFGSACLAAACGRARAAGQPVRVRKGIDEFARDPKALAALRAAVRKMRGLEPDHPFSWVFQANIHWRPFFPDYVYRQADESPDPAARLFRDKTGFTPPSEEQDVFNQCTHGNWWFLPWHRAYLYYFERALQWAAGDPALTLPYWNYSDPRHRELPPVFREPTVKGAAGDEPNPLYLPDGITFMNRQGKPEVFPLRDASLNGGLTQLTESATDVAAALKKPSFTTSPPAPGREGFGSPRACGLACGCGSGALEATPHNKVHNAIGGNAVAVGGGLRVGFMGDVATAARDPVFWLHHGNIDRLWESWLAAGGPHANPADADWLDRKFTFYDYDAGHPQGEPFQVRPSPRDLLSTEALGYRYDRLERPPEPVAARAVFLPAAQPPQALAETEAPKRAAGIPRGGRTPCPPGPSRRVSGSGPPRRPRSRCRWRR
ncbi:MAG TPA: tyrosinase family protein, partial [Gemmataceae bacterium]|nr:tyrosinase family protein [Gemmataceae bacterium]